MNLPKTRIFSKLTISLQNLHNNRKSISPLLMELHHHSPWGWQELTLLWLRRYLIQFTLKVRWWDICVACKRRISVWTDRWFLLEVARWNLMLLVRWFLWLGQDSTYILLFLIIKLRGIFKLLSSWEAILSQLLNLIKLASSPTVELVENMRDY